MHFIFSGTHLFLIETDISFNICILFSNIQFLGLKELSAASIFSTRAVLFPVERLDFSITFAAIKDMDDKKNTYVRNVRIFIGTKLVS